MSTVEMIDLRSKIIFSTYIRSSKWNQCVKWMPRWAGCWWIEWVRKLTVTNTTDVTLQTNTKISQTTLWNGLLKSLIIPWPKIARHVFRACHTNATGMIYCKRENICVVFYFAKFSILLSICVGLCDITWIPVPAYEPVKLTKLARLSVK